MQKIKFGDYTSAVFGVSAAIAMYSVTVPVHVHGYVPYTQLLLLTQCDRGFNLSAALDTQTCIERSLV